MQKKIILCVDDEPIILSSLKQELTKHFGDRMLVEVAESGQEALETIEFLQERGAEIEVIISDYIMPQMRGDEFLIKAHQMLPRTIKMLLTGQASIEGITNAINQTNLYRYIAKPWVTKDLIMSVEKAIEIYEKDKVIKLQNEQIQASIKYAQRIQSAILPADIQFDKLFSDHFIFYKPRDVVSGDFYWVVKKNNKTVLAAADCTGHGVPGAFMSLIGSQLLSRAVIDKQIYAPDKILQNLNENMKAVWSESNARVHEGMEIAVAMIDKDKNTLSFAGAKRPLCIAQNGNFEHIKGSRAGVDGKENITYELKELEINGKTKIYFYSDGYQDQFGGSGSRRFMSKNLRELLKNNSDKEMKEQLQIVQRTFEDWKGEHDQIDDILVMGIEI